MSTIPSSPAGEPHQAREAAESFGADPERYDRTRPRYPQELVDAIIAGSPGREFLDVGIGTGVSARPFQAAGCRVLGVEVDSRVAEFARERWFEVEVGRFEDWNAAGQTFDAIIAGMTWHWVDPAVGAAKAAGLLRAAGGGGVLERRTATCRLGACVLARLPTGAAQHAVCRAIERSADPLFDPPLDSCDTHRWRHVRYRIPHHVDRSALLRKEQPGSPDAAEIWLTSTAPLDEMQ